ncbi:hypothetical protein DWX43_04780 [Clostridium sp. AF19-22AC]|nr:hypothetical protein DWX43_04780 [Clostridium sp. AF19-22AC]
MQWVTHPGRWRKRHRHFVWAGGFNW